MTLTAVPAPMTDDERRLLLLVAFSLGQIASYLGDEKLYRRLGGARGVVEETCGISANEMQEWVSKVALPPDPKPKPWWRFWA